MSNRYKGGIISATPPTTNGPFEDGAASGAWTLEQQMQAAAAGTWPTAGNVGPDAFIENLFQTWLYTGNGSTQTITNGIDLAGEGGLVWIKQRDQASSNLLTDTVRGLYKTLITNSTTAQITTELNFVTGFNSNGFNTGTDINGSGNTYVSWTFRKQPKFFDVVTYTGNDSTQNIAHSLGSVPGCIIVKRTDSTGDWWVYHRSLTNTQYLRLNLTNAVGSSAGLWDSATPTSTQFTVGASVANSSGGTYVAYLFAHNAGGFGLTGTDNVISCGSAAATGLTTVDLGWEPQWVLIKSATVPNSWYVFDSMRGLTASSGPQTLSPSSSSAEYTESADTCNLTSTGFTFNSARFNGNATYIYIAIRRGPMKVPTDGTSVYEPFETTNSTSAQVIGSLPQPDMFLSKRTDGDQTWRLIDRLRGGSMLRTDSTDTETGATNFLEWDVQAGVQVTVEGAPFVTNDLQAHWLFRRAPSFFDEVCYTGTGSGMTVPHNLTVAPEMIIVKSRSNATNWSVFSNITPSGYKRNTLNSDSALNTIHPYLTTGDGYGLSAQPDSSNIYFENVSSFTGSGRTQVAYLFATCPGVSKVGSYTGTGTTLQINCGFTGGARFVMIKRTDSTGGWYVWDSARGIVAGNDPYLLINSDAAEVTNTDFVDTAATGFEISSTAPAAINASGGTFIFLAIA